MAAKHFDSKAFYNKLQFSLKYCDMNRSSFGEFKMNFMELLNTFAPLERKYLRTNSKFMTKELIKTIMLRTKLRSHFLKKRKLSSK